MLGTPFRWELLRVLPVEFLALVRVSAAGMPDLLNTRQLLCSRLRQRAPISEAS